MERATRETWAKRVASWRASGLTAAEFARKLGVREGTLRWWTWRLGSTRRESTEKAPSPLTFVEMTSVARRAPFAVVLASGTKLVVPSDFDGSALAKLLDVVERRR
jgi:hypothetical protein